MTLQGHLEEWSRKPFAWGSADCVRFAARWVELHTGADPMAGYDYASALEAARVLREGGGLERLVSRVLGPLQRDRRGMEPGAVVLSAFGLGQTLGIAATPRVFVVRSELGLVPVQAELAIGWWSCPQ